MDYRNYIKKHFACKILILLLTVDIPNFVTSRDYSSNNRESISSYHIILSGINVYR